MNKTIKIIKVLILILLVFSYTGFTQKYDTIIHTSIYTSYYNKTLKAPVVVSYKLYKGGGNCNRKGFNFTNDIETLNTAKESDYRKSGYDRGHLANAEDFAYNCDLMKLTFRYYNCVPQTPNLNRGIWKSKETKIRNYSQNDSLFIIIINKFGDSKIGDNVSVPEYCIKVVYNLKTLKPIFAFYTSNRRMPVYCETTINQIDSLFSVKVEKYLNYYLTKK